MFKRAHRWTLFWARYIQSTSFHPIPLRSIQNMRFKSIIYLLTAHCIQPTLTWDLVNKLYICKIEVFTAVTMKNAIFWDVVPCRSCVNRRFGGTYRLHLQGRKTCEQGTSVSRWLQAEPPVKNTQLYNNRKRGRVEGSVEMGEQAAGHLSPIWGENEVVFSQFSVLCSTIAT
jgi:hypothetical protein